MYRPANSEQARSWNGETGRFWAANATRFDEGVAAHHERFLAVAAITPTARVLDVGCGAGRSTLDAARLAPAGSALGVDLSAPLLDLARHRAAAERVPNATFALADAQTHPFPDAGFDVAISRTGAMFFDDPAAAFANIARALRLGGRLVLLTWQEYERNEWIRGFRSALGAEPMAPGSPGPFSLSDPGQVRTLLCSAGLVDVTIDSSTEPMYFGADVEDAFRFVTGHLDGLLAELAPARRAGALADLRADLAAHRSDRGVRYASAAWLITASRGQVLSGVSHGMRLPRS